MGDDDSPPDRPFEVWITEAGQPTGPSGPTGRRPGRGSGNPGRWIALGAGFVVLVAVIVVQHFAGGRPAASTLPTTSGASATTTASATGTSSSGGTAPAESAPATPTTAGASPIDTAVGLADPGSGVPETAEPERQTTTPSAPVTTTIRDQPWPGAGNWELVGYGPSGVVRYRPATGERTVTPVPTIQSSGPLSFVVTRHDAIIRPMDGVPGYLVPDGRPATALPDLLAYSPAAWPGPDPEHLWVLMNTYPSTVGLIDPQGAMTGTYLELPEMAAGNPPFSLTADGSGYLLAAAVGGRYDLTPDGPRLVTHGIVLAVGPTGFLVYDCDEKARCGVFRVDRSTWKRHALAGLDFSPSTFARNGVISPDGRYAAVQVMQGGSAAAQLVDLTRGMARPLPIDLARDGRTLGNSSLAFTPDGRYLLALGSEGVVPVDPVSGATLPPLPLPGLDAIAVRNLS